jgi:outer membrane lipoprotein-sorting protein
MPTRRSPRATLVVGLSLLAATAPGALAQPEPDPAAIVARADRIRFPQEGFQVDVSVTTTYPGRDPDQREYRILSKGNDNTIVLTTAPASERGQMMLMKEHDLWVFLPRVSQPVRLPLSQKLTGQVANGDLARANFAGDYTATLRGTETIGGRRYHVLDLKAAEKGVTYARVMYWVDVENYWPSKAEFYTRSNRLLKTCRYEGFKTMEGELRPTRLIMEDALKQGEQSVMEYRDMVLRDLEDKVFTKDYLKKLQ